MRAALYWVPEQNDPLTALGNAWLGRDAELGVAVPHPPVPDLSLLTEAPRRYGLHATLRAPMRIRGGWHAFEAAAMRVAIQTTPFALPPLGITNLDGFLALTFTEPCCAMHALADLCVVTTEAVRAPASSGELARRREAGLSPRQDELLTEFGYPYVLDQWAFHVTLTRRLKDSEVPMVLEAAQLHFGGALTMKRQAASICICTERYPPCDLLIAQRLKLGGV